MPLRIKLKVNNNFFFLSRPERIYDGNNDAVGWSIKKSQLYDRLSSSQNDEKQFNLSCGMVSSSPDIL